MTICDRAAELWCIAEEELAKCTENYTNYTICLVLGAVLLDLYDSGIVPDSDGANGPENTSTPEKDIVAMIARLEKEGWK